MKQHFSLSTVRIVCALLALATWVLDLLTPLGVADPILYIIVVFVALELSSTRTIIALSLFCSVLVVAGFFLSPEALEVWKAVLNRCYCLMALWAITIIGLERIKIQAEKDSLAQEHARLLTQALGQFIPVCAWCKKIRSDENNWQELETYLGTKTGATFTHGICPICLENLTGKSLTAGSQSKRQAQS